MTTFDVPDTDGPMMLIRHTSIVADRWWDDEGGWYSGELTASKGDVDDAI